MAHENYNSNITRGVTKPHIGRSNGMWFVSKGFWIGARSPTIYGAWQKWFLLTSWHPVVKI